MNPALRSLLERNEGLVTRLLASQVVPSWTLSNSCRAGELFRVLPEVYVDATLVRDQMADGVDPFAALPARPRRRAALAYPGERAALSHLTALDVWGLRRQGAGEPVHVCAKAEVGVRSRPQVVVHRLRGFAVEPPHVMVRDGMPITRLDRTLVDSWPLLVAEDQRAPIIRAVNDRMTTPARIGTTMAIVPKLSGRAELRVLLDRLAAGCRSPLEIWGHEHVFNGPGMPTFQRQVRVQVDRRTMYLDVYAEAERVNFELDGATTHGDPRQREIDLRRDALLATLGILAVRFTHRRLVREPDEVRREVLAILASRGK